MTTSLSTKVIQPFDNCDRCIAKAAYMVVFDAGDLYFCRHHFNKYQDSFMESALSIFDEDDVYVEESEDTPPTPE